MQSRIIGFTLIVCFIIGALLVFGIESAVQNHRKQKALIKQHRRAEFVRNFKADVVTFEGTAPRETTNERV